MATKSSLYYGDYLQLDKILESQHLQSSQYGAAAHDEHLFIIIHQSYELWFKQIIFELSAVLDTFRHAALADQLIEKVVHRVKRIVEIQKLLVSQLDILKTMTPLDFLEFRDFLVPASGFQSCQFHTIEILLGARDAEMGQKYDFLERLTPQDKARCVNAGKQGSLCEYIVSWLMRMPFLKTPDFDFMAHYQKLVTEWLNSREQIVTSSQEAKIDRAIHLRQIDQQQQYFSVLFDPLRYQALLDDKQRRFPFQAFLAALFVFLYREQPALQMPYQLLQLLIEVDDLFTEWRQRHALIVMRMIGAKLGTGGTAGYPYLKSTIESRRVFQDLAALTTYLIPRSALVNLPVSLQETLALSYSLKNIPASN